MSESASPQIREIATVWFLCAVVCGVPADVAALTPPPEQAPPPSQAEHGPTDNLSRAEAEAIAPPLQKEHHEVITAAMLVIAGVAFLGLMLVGLTILWGVRVRRLARRPLPEQSPIDELWYLKPRKSPRGASAGEPGSTGSSQPGTSSDPPEIT